VLFGALLLVGLAATAAAGQTGSSGGPTWLPTPARTLAALDCRCTPGAARIARYQRLLDKLSKRCKEPPGRLAYISTVATRGLREAGHRRTNLWMLNEVDQTISAGTRTKQPCRFVFALIVTSIQ
jgi:hypothetical protein